MGAWVVGENMVGYLPDSQPGAFAEWAEAAGYLRELAQSWGDESDERQETLCTDDCVGSDHSSHAYGSDRAAVDSIFADDPPQPGEDYGMIINSNDGPSVSIWLTWSPESDPDDDEVTS